MNNREENYMTYSDEPTNEYREHALGYAAKNEVQAHSTLPVGKQEEVLVTLMKALEDLELRLQPLLNLTGDNPVDKMGLTTEAKEPPHSELFTRIEGNTQAVRRATNLVYSLINRLEV